jgi:Ala-tRNA(Pro) deacylase
VYTAEYLPHPWNTPENDYTETTHGYNRYLRRCIMNMSSTLQRYLDQQGIQYELVSHPHTETSMNAATATHISAAKIAKPVILEDELGYLMAIVPAHHHVRISEINKLLGRKMGLATEDEITSLFKDCEAGAIPPVGQAYGLDTIFDDCLGECPDIYLEAGTHEDFIHLDSASYRQLMAQSPHASISM